jgi:choline transporter-like protein 2/4/5
MFGRNKAHAGEGTSNPLSAGIQLGSLSHNPDAALAADTNTPRARERLQKKESAHEEDEVDLWEPPCLQTCGRIGERLAACCVTGRKRRASSLDTQGQVGPERRHKCTDVAFLVFFLLYWVGMLVIFSMAYKTGDPFRLIYGTNAEGVTCGRGNYTGKRLIYYPRLHEDIEDALKSTYSPSDWASLAAKGLNPNVSLTDGASKFYGVCVSECPQAGDVVPDGESNGGEGWEVPLSTNNVLFRCLAYNNVTSYYEAKCILPDIHKTDPPIVCGNTMDCTSKVNNKYPDCVKMALDLDQRTEKLANSNAVYDFLTSGGAILTRAFGDMVLSTPSVLLCGGVLAMISSFAYLTLLQKFAKTMVWVTIWLVLLVLLIMTLVLCNFGGLLDRAWQDSYFTGVVTSKTGFVPEESDQDSRTQDYYRYTAYAFIAMDIVALCIILYLRKRVGIAVGILREASKAIRCIPALMVFPLIPCMAGIGFMLWWMWAAGYIFSAGEMVINPNISILNGLNATVRTFEGNEDKAKLMVYHFFGLLWTKNLFHAFVMYVIAGCVSEWYFKNDAGRRLEYNVKNGCGISQLMHHSWNALYYHLGSLCFGSFVIALLEMLRYVMEYINAKTQKLQKKSRIIACAFSCLRCLLWCFHKCVTFISRNGYILMSYRGGGFIRSSMSAVGLLRRNLMRVGLVQVISSFLLRLGTFTVMVVSVGMMLKLIRDPPEMWFPIVGQVTAGTKSLAKVSNPLLPIISTCVLSWAVACYCFAVYQMTIDTILVCFCQEHDEITKAVKEGRDIPPLYMSAELQFYIENMEIMHDKEEELEDISNSNDHVDNAKESMLEDRRSGSRRVYGMSRTESAQIEPGAGHEGEEGAQEGVKALTHTDSLSSQTVI